MNCVCPNAPAHDPFSFSAGTSPWSMILSVAINSERK